jgi:predicted RNA-binding protein associated with RNAse of E/G family
MKKKRADYPDWQRVPRKRFAMTHIESREFSGYISLLCLDAVTEPLWVTRADQDICLGDAGYTWLQHFPHNSHYALTTTFDAQGERVRHYIDICKRHYVDEHGILWYEDLYLDIDVSPEGEAMLLDVDELDAALKEGAVSSLDYELAWRVANSLMTAIENEMLPLLSTYGLCEEHRDQLLKMV